MAAPPKRVLCPYCGNKSPITAERCEACGGFFDDLSRRVTQQHMGPWCVRDPEHPFRPGCSFSVIAKQVERGKITTTTVLRGPTTKQFWAMAGHVPGVANLLGVCHACGEHVERTAMSCGKCSAAFPRPDERDELGLDPENAAVFEEAARAQAQFAAQQAVLRQQQAAQQKVAAAAAPAVAPVAAVGAPAKATVIATVTDKPIAPAAPQRPAMAPAAVPAAAASAPAPAVATASRPQPDLDAVSWMTPTGPNDQQAVPVGVDAGRSGGGFGGLWLWGLVGVNLLLAIAVVFILMGKDNADLLPPDAPTPNPAVDNDTPANANPGGSTNTNPPKSPTTPTTPGTPGSGVVITPGNGETIVVGPGETVTIPAPGTGAPGTTDTPKPPVNPGPGTGTETKPPSGGVSFFGIEAVPGAPRVTQAQIDELNRRFQEASDLAAAGKYPEALTALEDLRADLPRGVKSIGLDESIKLIREKVDGKKKVDDFFDG